MKLLAWVGILLLTWFPAASQSILNLDLEPGVNENKPLQLWYTQGTGYTFNIDTTTSRSGKGSLLVESKYAAQTGFATAYTDKLPVKVARSKLLTLTVSCLAHQSESVVQVYVSVLGSRERLNGITLTDTIQKPNQWYSLQAQCPIPATASRIAIGLRLFGAGKARFDQLEVLLDELPYQDLPLTLPESKTEPLLVKEPSPLELNWLQKHMLPIGSVSAAGSLADLTPLKSLLGSTQVIGLGEVSHGSSEIFQMKHRLIRYLVEQLDYRVVAMEADMAAAQQLNRYVLEGIGEPKQLLAGLGFWTWNTQEVLELLLWMRSHNQNAPSKVKFTGFDMQLPEAALENLWQFALHKDSLLKPALVALKESIQTFRNTNTRRGSISEPLQAKAKAAHANLVERMEVEKGYYLGIITLDEYFWLRQQVALLYQFIHFHLLPLSDAVRYRDVCMAENLHWLSRQYPTEKVVIWAHNGHVSKHEVAFASKPMGKYLKDNYGERYVNIGFAFGQGSYRGIDPATRKLATLVAKPAFLGSYEYFFQAINQPIFLLDLRNIALLKPTQWLFEPYQLRTVGAMPNPEEFSQTQLVKEFDLMLFMKRSTAAKAL